MPASNALCIAPIAQLVEHLICNQGVRGSSPCGGTIFHLYFNDLCIRCSLTNFIYSDLEALQTQNYSCG